MRFSLLGGAEEEADDYEGKKSPQDSLRVILYNVAIGQPFILAHRKTLLSLD